MVATGRTVVSQVLVCVAARFGRMGWPYEGIVYATTLKNTGALLQTMYLVATAMGLAPSAIGRGNSDLFATLAGTDYYAETTVGEFMLGSREGGDTR
jgi:SagB-type dehydrogenase family enzyme